MEFTFKKNIRIITDLLAYCHNRGAKHYQVDVNLESGVSVYEIRAALENYSETARTNLHNLLNIPRQREVEQSFWGLSGDVDTDPELELIGMMIDRAEVSFADGWLEIRIERMERKDLY